MRPLIRLLLLVYSVMAGSLFQSRDVLAVDVDVDFFENSVRPLLVEHCYECHSVESGESSGNLRLDDAPAMLRGGTLGPSLVPRDAEKSLLIRAIDYADDDLQMPPQGRLSEEEIQSFKTWIEGGAPDPRQEDMLKADSATSVSPMQRDVSSHWAFVPPRPIESSTWQKYPGPLSASAKDPIDQLSETIASSRGISVNPPADSETWLRRISFDLTGLPPTDDEIDSFVSDSRPDAFQRQVNRMLADPRYSERFTRHWLDVSRYSDTRGYALAGVEREITGAYRYRDWVLNAFAADMPYDEMIRHQLAADRTDSTNELGHADAMGFLTLGRRFLSIEDTIDDRIDVITRGLLGLTVSCARCHDHKFDPVPTADYYSLFNVLHNSVPPPGADPESGRRNDNKKPEVAPEVYEKGQRTPLLLVDREPLQDTRIFVRGDRGNRGEIAPRQYLTSFRGDAASRFQVGSGRLDLANAILSEHNPLAARVMVNRVWGQLMGRPMVDSPSDFGFRTAQPVLAGALDDLAVDFQSHWSIQKLVRRMVQLRTYGRTCDVDERQLELDPENQCFARSERRRRDFESLRDSMLFAADHLSGRFGGVSVEIAARGLSPRRSVYAYIDRQNLPGLFRNFDFANPDMHSPGRYYTTVPQQSLFLLNHPQVAEASRLAAIAARRNARPNGSEQSMIEALFRRVLSRPPNAPEMAESLKFVTMPPRDTVASIDPRTLWQYGTARWVDKQVVDFKPLEHFEDEQWRVESKFPSDGPLTYAMLSRQGGHAALGDEGIIVRRWTSPLAGQLKVTGQLDHEAEQGDGITAFVRVGNRQMFQAELLGNKRPHKKDVSKIKKGETVDFVVHSGKTLDHDSFRWQTQLSVIGPDGQTFDASSSDDFSGPFQASAAAGLDRLEQLAQILIMTDEFTFVD